VPPGSSYEQARKYLYVRRIQVVFSNVSSLRKIERVEGGRAGLNDLCYVLRRVRVYRLLEDSLGLGSFAAALG
jgi:hypothetical protein